MLYRAIITVLAAFSLCVLSTPAWADGECGEFEVDLGCGCGAHENSGAFPGLAVGSTFNITPTMCNGVAQAGGFSGVDNTINVDYGDAAEALFYFESGNGNTVNITLGGQGQTLTLKHSSGIHWVFNITYSGPAPTIINELFAPHHTVNLDRGGAGAGTPLRTEPLPAD